MACILYIVFDTTISSTDKLKCHSSFELYLEIKKQQHTTEKSSLQNILPCVHVLTGNPLVLKMV